MTTQIPLKWKHFLSSTTNSIVLWALTDGRAYTAIELAHYACISKTKVRETLEGARENGLLLQEHHRHRYYRLANDAVCGELNELLSFKMNHKPRIYTGNNLSDLEYCRSCHGHLAGKIGRKITTGLQDKGFLIWFRKEGKYEFELTDEGEHFFNALGIVDTESLRVKSGIFAKACLDFSERKHHLGGRLGVAFLENLKTKNWICESPHSRVHQLTEEGKINLNRSLDLNL